MLKLTAACGRTFCIFTSLLAASCAKHYKVDGMVLRLEPTRQSVVVSHRDIQGYMPAMVMPFRVRNAAELRDLAPGARIRFQLVVGRRDSYIHRIQVTEGVTEGLGDGGEPVRLPVAEQKLAVGAAVPDFSLTDQLGRTVRLSDFRGKVVAVSFIYTRCPLPNVCPRLSANFARLQRRFQERMGRDLVLLSVSIDPQHDTPEVLAGYGKIWGARPEGWRFLTGDPAEIRRLAGRFGMVYWAEEGALTHTSDTGIISRDGRLAARVEGSAYAVSQLGDLLALELQ